MSASPTPILFGLQEHIQRGKRPLPLNFTNVLPSKAVVKRQKKYNDGVGKLKKRYTFVDVNKIAFFLRCHPSLITDLNKIFEMKSRYFGESPMSLYYMSDTGLLEDATLAAYIRTDMPREKARELFDQFDDEWEECISEDAKHTLMVDLE